ncbi:MAG: DUF3368 domain-containing protein [Candidatus Aenigmatarchaeota archaeon]
MPCKVVSNTSPLLNLALIDCLNLLESQFEELMVPEQVWNELEEGEEGLEDLEELRDKNFIEVVEVKEDDFFREILEDIDMGEAAAIRYSIEEDADLILLDEKEAREAANRHHLETTGVVGILLKAAGQGKVDLRDEVENLRSEGFWLSDELVEKITEEAG